jgi:hypothetical protein
MKRKTAKQKRDKFHIKGSTEAKAMMKKVRDKKDNFLFKSKQEEENWGI